MKTKRKKISYVIFESKKQVQPKATQMSMFSRINLKVKKV